MREGDCTLNILICGLLWSGSGALLDMLREYDDVGLLPGEFDEFRRPGMIADHLDGRISAIYPSRIRSWSLRGIAKRTLLKEAVNGNINFFRDRTQFGKLKPVLESHSLSFENKVTAVRAWLQARKNNYAPGKKFLVIDQPILASQHFNIWPQVLSPFKLVLVYRDPRDQLAQIIKQKQLFRHMNSLTADIYGGDRLGAMRLQIDALKSRIAWYGKINTQHGNDKTAFISFERLILEHERMREKLENWIGLGPCARRNSVLKLDISAKNIGIYEDYLNRNEISMLDELVAMYHEHEARNCFY